jgi:hypothetical protein
MRTVCLPNDQRTSIQRNEILSIGDFSRCVRAFAAEVLIALRIFWYRRSACRMEALCAVLCRANDSSKVFLIAEI